MEQKGFINRSQSIHHHPPVGKKNSYSHSAYVASQVILGIPEPKLATANQCITLSIKTPDGEKGSLGISTYHNEGPVMRDVKALSQTNFLVSFKPTAAVPHFVNVTFDNVRVPRSPLTIEVHPPRFISYAAKSRERNAEPKALVNQMTNLNIAKKTELMNMQEHDAVGHK